MSRRTGQLLHDVPEVVFVDVVNRWLVLLSLEAALVRIVRLGGLRLLRWQRLGEVLGLVKGWFFDERRDVGGGGGGGFGYLVGKLVEVFKVMISIVNVVGVGATGATGGGGGRVARRVTTFIHF